MDEVDRETVEEWKRTGTLEDGESWLTCMVLEGVDMVFPYPRVPWTKS